MNPVEVLVILLLGVVLWLAWVIAAIGIYDVFYSLAWDMGRQLRVVATHE